MAGLTGYEPHQLTNAFASGRIGSALEYYDFCIYALVAALIFPRPVFPSGSRVPSDG